MNTFLFCFLFLAMLIVMIGGALAAYYIFTKSLKRK